MTFTLTSTKAKREISVNSLDEAVYTAIKMELELDPVFGVTVESGGTIVAEVRDGVVEICD